MDLSVRTFLGLAREDIHTVGDIIALTRDDLKNIRSFGKKSYEEIVDRIISMGLTFEEDT